MTEERKKPPRKRLKAALLGTAVCLATLTLLFALDSPAASSDNNIATIVNPKPSPLHTRGWHPTTTTTSTTTTTVPEKPLFIRDGAKSRTPSSSCPPEGCKLFIYNHESGNNPGAVNSAGCRGLGQACPGSKLPCADNDYACQDAWFTNYMLSRYGSWERAYAFWLTNHWW